jgi:hypothetical protein
MLSQDLAFERKQKMYVAEWCEGGSIPDFMAYVTVQENEQLYIQRKEYNMPNLHTSS